MVRALVVLVAIAFAAFAPAQVHYHEDGRPWRQRAGKGPDKDVPGWFYNLGVTGLRVELVADEPTHLVVRHVLPGSPAAGKIEAGDHVVGAGGRRFQAPHRNGYGMDVFGPDGPILDFANALEDSLGDDGEFECQILRDGKRRKVRLALGSKHGSYTKTFPRQCKKSERLREELVEWLAARQHKNGSWGSAPNTLFAGLALLASGNHRYRQAVERCARFHARTTKAKDHGSLINWRYMAAGIFLSEYYLATRQRWVLQELQEVHDFLLHSQYMDLSQLNPKSRETHPGAVPKKAGDAVGGWGHNPGFEGYGPIAMITGQGALTLALMKHCGLDIEQERHEAAYSFLQRGTGRNGYVWYEDSVAGHNQYADMGRTGAAGVACWLSPWPGDYKKRALAHARCIGQHPDSFPDTHGSPTMGMAFAALAAWPDRKSFDSLMRANRWWFTLSRCSDSGTFYYQPNRDNAGYGSDSRLKPTAVVALILSIPRQSLVITGKPVKR